MLSEKLLNHLFVTIVSLVFIAFFSYGTWYAFKNENTSAPKTCATGATGASCATVGSKDLSHLITPLDSYVEKFKDDFYKISIGFGSLVMLLSFLYIFLYWRLNNPNDREFAEEKIVNTLGALVVSAFGIMFIVFGVDGLRGKTISKTLISLLTSKSWILSMLIVSCIFLALGLYRTQDVIIKKLKVKT